MLLAKRRVTRQPQVNCKWGHSLTGDNLVIYGGTQRACRLCKIIFRLHRAGNHDPATHHQRSAASYRARNAALNLERCGTLYAVSNKAGGETQKEKESGARLPPAPIVPGPDLSASHADWMLYHGIKKKCAPRQ